MKATAFMRLSILEPTLNLCLANKFCGNHRSQVRMAKPCPDSLCSPDILSGLPPGVAGQPADRIWNLVFLLIFSIYSFFRRLL